MDFDPKQIPILHENPMYLMEQNQRFQHICDIVVQVSNIEKIISNYIFTGDHICTLLKDVINTSSEIEFVCTNQDFGLILEAFDFFQDSLRNHFKEIQDYSLIEMRNLVKKDFPELIESKKAYSKNIERYYQVQDHYLSLPKKSKTKIFKERQNEYRKAFTDSSTSFFEYVIKLDAIEAKISNLIGTFLVNFPKSFLRATKPALEKQIQTTENIVNSICPDYKSIAQREQNFKQEFLSSIPQFFQRMNSHLGAPIESDPSPTSSSQTLNQPLSSSENQSTSSNPSDSKSSSQNFNDSQKVSLSKTESSNQTFSAGNSGEISSCVSNIMTKQGYMWKRCGKVTKTWERRYCVCNQGVLSYSVSVETATNPSNTIQLVFAAVQPNESEERPYVFNLVTQRKVYTFQAPSQLDYDEWVNAIQNGIVTGLSTYSDDIENQASANANANINVNVNANSNAFDSSVEPNNSSILNSSAIENDSEVGQNNSGFQFEQNSAINTASELSDFPELGNIKESGSVSNDVSPTRFPLRRFAYPNESPSGGNENPTRRATNHSSDFNFLSLRRFSSNKKTNTYNTTLGSASESIPKIPIVSSSPLPTCCCADCGSGRADWCIINRGLVICENCAGIHRSLPNISTVRSLRLDRIDKYNLKMMSLMANNMLNNFIEATIILYDNEMRNSGESVKRINSTSSMEERTEFIRKKYVDKEFIDPTFLLMTNRERQKIHEKRRDKKTNEPTNESTTTEKYNKDKSSNESTCTEKHKDKSSVQSAANEKYPAEASVEKSSKAKSRSKSKDDDQEASRKDKKEKKSKSKTESNNNDHIQLQHISSTHSLGDSDSIFPSLNVPANMVSLEAEDDDIENITARKHQEKRRHNKQVTTARRRSLTSSQGETKSPERSHHHRNKSDSHEQTTKQLSSVPSLRRPLRHDVFNAIQTNDLLELMKIAFLDGLVDASLRGNFRPIHAAACVGNPLIIVAIIENDVMCVDATDDNGWTALSYAAFHGNEKAVECLIAYGARIETCDAAHSPLVIAKEMHHDAVLKKLTSVVGEVNLNGSLTAEIVPLNSEFTPQEIPTSMVIVDEVVSSPQPIKPMTDADMSQIQQALKNMSKRPKMRRKSVTDTHKAIGNSDEY